MREFNYNFLKEKQWDKDILGYIGLIHEFKGKQQLYLKQKPAELDRLIEIAKVQSTESSNAIEGIVTTNQRLKQLMSEKTAPRNRDEQEILGYRAVLEMVHESFEYMPITANVILQLHKKLYSYMPTSFGGVFKTTSNEIDEIRSDGTVVVRFKPLEPFETPEAVERLCETYNKIIASGEVDPLVVIPTFIHDFLCIHPFNDGNGRMSRILTTLLLYKSGYVVGKYISLEKKIHDHKNEYYDALQLASENWHEGKNDDSAFTKYILGDKRYYYSQDRENQFATDCSWLIITSLQEIGIPTNGATYTGNMCKELSGTGYFNLYPFRYTDIIRGDILVKHISGSNGHTVLYIGDGKILEACNKKYGLRKCNYYANGYQYILRLKENCTVNDLPLIKKGSKGLAVCFLQLFLNKYMGNRLVIDGDFGNKTHEATINAQIKMGFSGSGIDGEVGVKTWTKIYSIMVHG